MIRTTCRWARHLLRHRAAPVRRNRISFRPVVEEMECRQLLSVTPLLESATPLVLGSTHAGTFAAAPRLYAFELPDSGRLTAEVVATGGATRLALLSSEGELLLQSNGQSSDRHQSIIDVHLLPQTTYYLSVERLGSTPGGYELAAFFTATTTPHEALPVGNAPWSSTSGDFNQDGQADLAIANFDGSSLIVYLGVGDGTFTSGTTYACGSGANAIIAGDWNNDRILDLATANVYSDSVSVLLGVGDGSFHAARDFAAGSGASWLVAGDFNADGHHDFAVPNLNVGTVAILLNLGDGTFAQSAEYEVGLSPYGVVAGDFNRDDAIDLAVANYDSDDVSILLGDGGGRFIPGSTVRVGHQPYAPITGDFNFDSYLDIAVTNYGSNDVSILLGVGDGNFHAQAPLTVGSGPTAVTAADFNDDGIGDLAVANLTDGTVSILLAGSDGQMVPQPAFTVGVGPTSLTAADYNGDGIWDLAVTDLTPNAVEMVFGRGNGSFHTKPSQSPATQVFHVVSADFNGDDIPDLATVNYSANDVMIRLGQADGTFRFGGRFAVGADGVALAVGDLNGDRIPDLVTANYSTNDVSVLLGLGDGRLSAPTRFDAAAVPFAVLLVDMNGDGNLDAVVVDQGSSGVSILHGDGAGAFAAPEHLGAGDGPVTVVAADFNGDDRPDLAVANQQDNSVSILLSQAQGGLGLGMVFQTGQQPAGIAVGDFNADHQLDLAVDSEASNRSTIFVGDGAGAFSSAGLDLLLGVAPIAGDFDRDGQVDLATIDRIEHALVIHQGAGHGSYVVIDQIAIGEFAYRGTAADVNNDHHLDLLIANQFSNVAVILGQGDGRFAEARKSPVVGGPLAIASADFNSDGQLDWATANPTTGLVSVSLGSGDGMFAAPSGITLDQPVGLAAADFNRDGRPDLAVAEYLDNSIAIVLGVGDGSLSNSQRYVVGSRPVAVVSADLNRDGLADLAVANYGSDSVSVLLNQGNATFGPSIEFGVGVAPVALAAADVDGDGITDLVAANSLDHSLTTLVGNGHGSFRAASVSTLTGVPGALVIGDFNDDGIADLAAADQAGNRVFLVPGHGHGVFGAASSWAVEDATALVADDFDHDGKLDLVAASHNGHAIHMLQGDGEGGFVTGASFDVGAFPKAVISGDFNRDGRPDIASANGLGEAVSIGLGLAATFVAPELAANPVHAKPLLADFNKDGRPDVAVLRQDGGVLVRFGSARSDDSFEPPVLINPGLVDGAQQIGLVRAFGDVYLAALAIAGDHLTVYAHAGARAMTPSFLLQIPSGMANHMLITDLMGDANDDLVFADAGTGRVLVYTQESYYSGQPPVSFDVGPSPSNIAVADVDGDQRPDLLVTDQFSGDVRVLHGQAIGLFAGNSRFRTGLGIVSVENASRVYSLDAPIAMVSGPFDDLAGDDLVVLNQGTNRVALLRNDGHGGFFDPESPRWFGVGGQPVDIVAAHFDGDPHLDVAVLNRDTQDVSLFRGDGLGGFSRMGTVAAGRAPTGLASADINVDGRADLLVGNGHGDVLTLLGDGSGAFKPYERLDRNVRLALHDRDDGAGVEFAFANQAHDRVVIDSADMVHRFEQNRQDGVLAPSDVRLVDINADRYTDLLVANSGGNEVLVFLGGHTGLQNAPQRYFVGTNPGSLTVSDLNADGFLDLVVANTGSNDVSTLLGQGAGAGWDFVQGPRLNAGQGPTAAAVADIDGDDLADIVVANGVSNDVYVLHGVGAGFFADTQPTILPTGLDPNDLFVGEFDGMPGVDLVTINRGSNDLTFASGLQAPHAIMLTGTVPAAAAVDDLNFDGVFDLVVASETGHFTLFYGDATGPVFGGDFMVAGLSDLSDIALYSHDGNVVEIYATRLGVDGASLLYIVFTLDNAAVQTEESSAAETLQTVLSQQATGFSISADAPFEVFATLVFDSAAVSPSTDEPATMTTDWIAEEEIPEVDEAPTFMADEASIERNALLAGVTAASAQAYLDQAPESTADVPFPSPLRWFEPSNDADIAYWESTHEFEPCDVDPAAAPIIPDAIIGADAPDATARSADAAPAMHSALPTLVAYLASTLAAERTFRDKRRGDSTWTKLGDRRHATT